MTDDLRSYTQALLRHVFWFKQDFGIEPRKEHIGSAINWSDINERKHDFLSELINTISSWVYGKAKSKRIIDERLNLVQGDLANASTFLTIQAFSKFRPGEPQGQFGELLLYNFIQYFFEAVPLLRKQNLTTSVGHERFGADAIHFKADDSGNTIYLGESKCYKSDYQFNPAFKKSLESIQTTFSKLDQELDLYVYDDFIEPELENVAKKYKQGELEDIRYELVCLVAYNENRAISGSNEAEIKISIENIIKDRCSSVNANIFPSMEPRVLSRINYIIFPIWKLDELLETFQARVGSV